MVTRAEALSRTYPSREEVPSSEEPLPRPTEWLRPSVGLRIWKTKQEQRACLLELLDNAEKSVDIVTLCADYLPAFIRLSRLIGRGLPARMIVDEKQFLSPACSRQTDRLREFVVGGGALKTYRPTGGKYAAMHAKSVLVDGVVACAGSLNLTHNAYDYSKEYLFEIREPSIVHDLAQDFEETWGLGQKVTSRSFKAINERKRRETRGSGDEYGFDSA